MLERLRWRKEWMFFATLPRAGRGLALTWWTVVVLHGSLPVLYAIAMGLLVGAVERGDTLVGP